ncbi:MAG: phytanoyl-CoA dioxygenase family protein [Candidatus Hydrogenedentes bacterium]|nr:phytanoyl-CoA dioxygenase family protein [Candidatus Hydrogenedentota bacterium]
MFSSAERAAWEKDGYVRLGQVMTDAELAALQQRIDAIMMGEIVYEGMFFQIDSTTGNYGDLTGSGYAGPTLNYRKIQDLERDPLFLAYMQKPIFRDITRALVGENISCFRAMFMNKPAHRGTVLPYHQDGGGQWELDREKFVTIWTALDPSTLANGCVQIIPGSHTLGLLSERGHTITPEQEAQYCKEEDSIYLEAKPGESFLLHNYVLHRSGVNTSSQSRRAFSVVYMDATTRSTRNGGGFPVIFGDGALIPGRV